MILGFTNKNDLVLDPFMGSGTTAAVSMNNGRLSLGFEMRKDYCQTIKKRLEAMVEEDLIKEMNPMLFSF
jgi:adenine-specific DNA-methyltransferase